MEMQKTFLSGPAGTGKTSTGVEHLTKLCGTTFDGVVVYVPQKISAEPYINAVQYQYPVSVDFFTIGSLSRKMVEIYWPLISEISGFTHPFDQPTFLNLEGAQYFIAHVLRPFLNEGLFDSVTINRNRLYTQVLDNLNKAALNGYSIQEIGSRLRLAVVGDSEQQRIYEDAQVATKAFRKFCLANNILDFSLQLEIFWKHLWQEEGLCRDYIRQKYQHILVDNIEETTPIEHEIIRGWLPDLDSALLIYDNDGGFRTFLGADPESAKELMHICDNQIKFAEPIQSNQVLESLGNTVGRLLKRPVDSNEILSLEKVQEAVVVVSHRYFPDMLDWVADNIRVMVQEDGIPHNEIAVLTPFLSDALRYSLTEKLDRFGIPSRSHRPSRSLRDEPVSQALITLAMLAHPEWVMPPSTFDVAYMFVQILGDIDLVRAQILSEIVFRIKENRPDLSSFNRILPEMQERITYVIGEKYEYFRLWMERYIDGPEMELDFFMAKIFGEVLSQPGFGFHGDYSAGDIAANLIDSIKNYRLTTKDRLKRKVPWGKEYIQMVQQGVIAAQYLRNWRTEDFDSIMLQPAYTFLMQNRAVDYQFWLDIGSYGWHKRIYQPVTHPFVLNRNWPIDRNWTDNAEIDVERESLYRLVVGLFRRCKKMIYLGLSNMSEAGYENDGMLLRTFQGIYQQLASKRTN